MFLQNFDNKNTYSPVELVINFFIKVYDYKGKDFNTLKQHVKNDL